MSRKSTRGDNINLIIGSKIQELRIAKGWSRPQLAVKIDVTHQQLQKYEKGANRISADRLVYLAEAFKVDISFFFEGLLNEMNIDASNIAELHHPRMAIEVSRNFMGISNPIHQNAINMLVRSLMDKGE